VHRNNEKARVRLRDEARGFDHQTAEPIPAAGAKNAGEFSQLPSPPGLETLTPMFFNDEELLAGYAGEFVVLLDRVRGRPSAGHSGMVGGSR
jgi:hypothetical protein